MTSLDISMSPMRKIIFLFIYLGFFNQIILAQTNPQNIITGDFKRLSITDFVKKLKQQTNYYFYYDPSKFDSSFFTLSADREPLTSVLNRAFQNTSFKYSIDSHNQVFLTKDIVIQTTLIDQTADSLNGRNHNGYVDRDEGKNNTPSLQYAKLENKLYEIGINSTNNGQSNVLISGIVRDVKTGEPVSGASLYIDKPYIGSSTDQYGYYTLLLPKGRFTLNIQSIGMKDTRRQILLKGDGQLNIDLQSQVMMLKNVIISAEKINNIRGVQMGVTKLDIKTLKQVPVVFGETDLLRVLLTLPGVKSVGEASTGLNVRGGSADQNLVLFNDATIY
jgi:CarboxypepD_reg-like domain